MDGTGAEEGRPVSGVTRARCRNHGPGQIIQGNRGAESGESGTTPTFKESGGREETQERVRRKWSDRRKGKGVGVVFKEMRQRPVSRRNGSWVMSRRLGMKPLRSDPSVLMGVSNQTAHVSAL